jgi:hypothetical protein
VCIPIRLTLWVDPVYPIPKSALMAQTYRWPLLELLLTINGLSSRAALRRVFATAREGEAEDSFCINTI